MVCIKQQTQGDFNIFCAVYKNFKITLLHCARNFNETFKLAAITSAHTHTHKQLGDQAPAAVTHALILKLQNVHAPDSTWRIRNMLYSTHTQQLQLLI